MAAAETLWYQPVMKDGKRTDPIAEPWQAVPKPDEPEEPYELPAPANYAPGPVHVTGGVRGIYGSWGPGLVDKTYGVGCSAACEPCKLPEATETCPPASPAGCQCVEAIELVRLDGAPPRYTLEREEPLGHRVVQNSFTAFPSVLDAHVYYDTVDLRLWMSWGGWTMFLTELDPDTGLLKDPALRATPEVRDHPEGTHTPILSWAPGPVLGGDAAVPDGWEGDAFAASSYMEGPAMFRHGDIWYAFGSYGYLVEDYTIRMCRRLATDPRGEYVDKDGLVCTKFDAEKNRYGASMLLSQEGNHTVPGHPHIWAEPGADGPDYFLGYDYREYSCKTKLANDDDEGAYCDNTVPGQTYGGKAASIDWAGVRRLRFVEGWPTIWEPIEVSLRAGPEHHGQPLVIRLENAGEAGSVAGFDLVSLDATAPGDTPGGPGTHPGTPGDGPATAGDGGLTLLLGSLGVVLLVLAAGMAAGRCFQRGGERQPGNEGAVQLGLLN